MYPLFYFTFINWLYYINMGDFMHEVLDWLYSIVVALILAMIIHIFIFVPTRVSGESMYPSLQNGQYLIVSKIGHVLPMRSLFKMQNWLRRRKRRNNCRIT